MQLQRAMAAEAEAAREARAKVSDGLTDCVGGCRWALPLAREAARSREDNLAPVWTWGDLVATRYLNEQLI